LQFGVAVTEFGASTKLAYSTSGPVSTGTGDRLRTGKPHRYVTSHPGQLSLLLSAGREISTGQSVVMLCSWGAVKHDLLFHVYARAGGR